MHILLQVFRCALAYFVTPTITLLRDRFELYVDPPWFAVVDRFVRIDGASERLFLIENHGRIDHSGRDDVLRLVA